MSQSISVPVVHPAILAHALRSALMYIQELKTRFKPDPPVIHEFTSSLGRSTLLFLLNRPLALALPSFNTLVPVKT